MHFRSLGALRNPLPLLFCQRCIDVEREVVTISAQLGHDKMHLVLHESGNEVHVSRQTVEPRNKQRAAPRLRILECRGKSWAQEQSFCRFPSHGSSSRHARGTSHHCHSAAGDGTV